MLQYNYKCYQHGNIRSMLGSDFESKLPLRSETMLGEIVESKLLKVSANSKPTAVAGAIAGVIRQYRFAELQAIGAGAVNQAVKSLAIARGYLDEDSLELMCIPVFTEVDIDGNERTAIRFEIHGSDKM
jgi:stage V sporulation protein S